MKRAVRFLISAVMTAALLLPAAAGIAEEAEEEQLPGKIRVSDGTNTVIYQLNDSPSAQMLYGMMPLDVQVENYGNNEKIFYLEQEIDTDDGIESGGEAGALALFSPWGNIVMYYDSFSAYEGLYILGQAVEGTDLVRNLSGLVHIEAVE